MSQKTKAQLEAQLQTLSGAMKDILASHQDFIDWHSRNPDCDGPDAEWAKRSHAKAELALSEVSS